MMRKGLLTMNGRGIFLKVTFENKSAHFKISFATCHV